MAVIMTDPSPRDKDRIKARIMIEAKIAEIDQGYLDGAWKNPWPNDSSIQPEEINAYWRSEREELEKDLNRLGRKSPRPPWETSQNMDDFRQDVRDLENASD